MELRNGGEFIETLTKTLSIADVASDHKALDLRILEVSKHCDYADYFLIMTALSSTHARALVDAIAEKYPSKSVPEGYTLGEWVLLDLGDVVVHVFTADQRVYYNFDKLWGHATRIDPESMSVVQEKTHAQHSSM